MTGLRQPVPRRVFALASVFLSAFLLFSLEPMVGKMLLPDFGGSPAVWGTCLMFFQGLLLAGYGYGHLVARLAPRRVLAVHLAVLLLPFLVLPLRQGSHAPSPGSWPVPALIVGLFATAGLPFFALSTNTSLVQHWYARRSGQEPYFLYAASNAGSFSSLMAYPFLVERTYGLHSQSHLLLAGYALFVMATLATAWILRVDSLPVAAASKASPVPEKITWTRRFRWLALSTIGSVLLLAVSIHISAEVAAVPLLWVVPLAIYLLTFVVAFTPRLPFPRRHLAIVAALFVILGLVQDREGALALLTIRLAIPLGALFVGCWLCHGDLAKDRPPPGEVTSFYLWVAMGGFLGGVLGSIVAPLVFQSVAEWPLSLAALALVASSADGGRDLLASARNPRAWVGPALFAGALLLAIAGGRMNGRVPLVAGLVPLLVLLAGILLWRFPGQFFAASMLVAVLGLTGFPGATRPLDERRSFFGVVRVEQTGHLRIMYHGQTVHGAQEEDPLSPDPLLYYTAAGPMGSVARDQAANARIAVVGMGTGSLAALAVPGQKLTFYEIDPIVEPMARKWFTFLSESPAQVSTVLGDARLMLRGAPEAGYDLIVLDAFSGDATPAHLLTVEAFRLYLGKLDPHGVLLLHVSNRYLDLIPLVSGAAHALGLPGAVDRYRPSDSARWDFPSDVVAVSPDASRLAPLLARGWRPLAAEPLGPVWTDDRSSVLDVLKTR